MKHTNKPNTMTRKEELYLVAIQNLFKIKNFRELHQDMLGSLLTESERDHRFEKELKENFEKYTIQIKNTPITEKDLKLIFEIMKEIGEETTGDITTSDVAELFSLSSIKLDEMLNKKLVEKV